MKPIPDHIVERNPQRYALFVELVEASKALQAAILQDNPEDLQKQIKNHDARLQALLDALRGDTRCNGNSERNGQAVITIESGNSKASSFGS